MKKRTFVAGILGNIFDHYDKALFGLLAPFIAPLFFPEKGQISALILIYGMMVLGLLSKPIGALFFGYIGDRYGRKRALSFTLMGMAIVTIGMGCLPTYAQVGRAAPMFLGLCRLLQSFFAAGETTGGAILILEAAEEGQKSFLSSLYDSSTILGIFLASGVVTLFSFQRETFVHFWRVPFFIGSICGIWGFFIRLYLPEPVQQKQRVSIREHFSLILKYRAAALPIIFAAGFSYCTYLYATTFMNGYLPFVTTITKEQACRSNTFLLLLDFILLPLFGFLATRWVKEKLMMWCALLVMVLAFPLFSLLPNASSQVAIVVRIVFVTLGVGFAAPFHHWAQEKVPAHVRYTLVATASALGSQLIGMPSAAISLWLYQKTGWVAAPSFYFMGVAGLAAFAILLAARRPAEVT
ncbi:MAG: Proline/betaine transporter [Chlamydiae bacterium]|nr:Proline/betaine transporter [Chlamydiota bacterium]